MEQHAYERFTSVSWQIRRMAYYLPIKYSEVPRYIRENCRTDVVAIQVAPMDEHGYFSFGVSVSHYAAAI